MADRENEEVSKATEEDEDETTETKNDKTKDHKGRQNANSGRKKSPRKEKKKKSASSSSSSSSPSRKSRANKIYRTPVTPEPEVLLFKEKSFVLDCNATSSISSDYSKVNPKLGPVIPPYNSLRDRHVQNYFGYYGVQKTLKKNNQTLQVSTSLEGAVADRFHQGGAGAKYITLRNGFGAGHSQETINGHAQFMEGVKEVTGFNGKFGFRRNTPWLRIKPTPFEPAIIVPTH